MVVVAVAMIAAAALVAVAHIFRPRSAPPALPMPAERPVSVLDEYVLEPIVVTLKSGTSFAGVLYAEDAGAVVVCKAELLEQDGKRLPVDGEVVLLRAEIDFIQRP